MITDTFHLNFTHEFLPNKMTMVVDGIMIRMGPQYFLQFVLVFLLLCFVCSWLAGVRLRVLLLTVLVLRMDWWMCAQ